MRYKRLISWLLVITIIQIMIGFAPLQRTYATTKYISRLDVLKKILNEMQVEYLPSDESVIATAKQIGLLTDKTFRYYNVNATKADMAVLLVRADQYLYHTQISESLINEIIQKRISDISVLSKAVQPYLAKSYALGYIKGNSNGIYSKDRTFHPKYRVTYAYAEQLIGLIRDTKNRHQISPDGQLIRTTNLPKLAGYYSYILASFPNEYYDLKFEFMCMYNAKTNENLFDSGKLTNLVDYAAPKDILKYRENEEIYSYDYNHSNKSENLTFSEVYEKNINRWEENILNYLELAFNFDYRTCDVDSKWYDEMLSLFNEASWPQDYSLQLFNYIKQSQEDKIILESEIIGFDLSDIYINDDNCRINAYVRYRINSYTGKESIIYDDERPIIFNDFFQTHKNVVLGQWREVYVTIGLRCESENGLIHFIYIDD